MIPFEELCAALDRHRRGLAPEAHAAPAHEEAHDPNATQLGMEAPALDPVGTVEIDTGTEPRPDTTGEIDLDDVVDLN